MGHSFGGYLVSNYALKYFKYIIKLILLSPVGMKETNIAQKVQPVITLDYAAAEGGEATDIKPLNLSAETDATSEGDCAGFSDFPKPIAMLLETVWKKKISP